MQCTQICRGNKMMSSTSRDDHRDDDDDLNGVYSQFRAFALADLRGAAVAFLKEMRKRFRKQHDGIFVRFCQLLSDFTKSKIDRDSLGLEVKELFKGHDDLIHKYNVFVRNEADDEEDGAGGDSDHDDDDNHEPELKTEVAKLFGDEHGDLYEEFERYVAKCREQKHVIKSIQDLDLSKCKQVSPSYWRLPEYYWMPLASNRSEIGDQVLNDNLVCASTGTERSSFKQRRRTKQEEVLFKCEDDRFELDLLLGWMHSAAENVEKLMIKIDDQNQDDEKSSKIEIEGHLGISDLRCIERLYAEHGLDVIDNLHKNPETALPVILKSLKQKVEELVERRSDCNKIWAHVCAKNHDKLQEMQRELKNSKREDLVAKEEKLQKEEEMNLDVGGNKQ
ncbi:hypothetical protein CISIN_1g016325mg [Citrus sinensis]|uniref:Histone deacetylase interacting domain-containing protein n=1 Tax=Citrus sinensis TaxID=2711 RepID=A0A067DUY9_CITSI|nr:hypothetical protein CISIN_1g016325mg [Citrus sinensis]